MRTRKKRKRLRQDEAARSTQLDFILKLLKAKIGDGNLLHVVEALNFLGFADNVLTIIGFNTAHARKTYEASGLAKDKPLFAWELCHVTGLTFADEYKCTFVGGPHQDTEYNSTVMNMLVDRLLYVVMVENRDVLKTVFKMFDKSNQHGIVEV